MGPGPYQVNPAGPYPNQGPPQTVIITQPRVVAYNLHEAPAHVQCPHCRAEVVTATNFEAGTLAWVACLLLCIFG